MQWLWADGGGIQFGHNISTRDRTEMTRTLMLTTSSLVGVGGRWLRVKELNKHVQIIDDYTN